MEYTFVMIRPGTFRRDLEEYIIDRIYGIGLDIEYLHRKRLTPEFIEKHYAHLHDKSIPEDVFTRTAIENLSGPVVGMIVSGEDAIKKMRQLIGPGNVKKAKEEFPNCIRALGNPNNNPDNLIHASDSYESAIIEIRRFFNIDITNKEEREKHFRKFYNQKKYKKILNYIKDDYNSIL